MLILFFDILCHLEIINYQGIQIVTYPCSILSTLEILKSHFFHVLFSDLFFALLSLRDPEREPFLSVCHCSKQCKETHVSV